MTLDELIEFLKVKHDPKTEMLEKCYSCGNLHPMRKDTTLCRRCYREYEEIYLDD
jgi:ribosomal protein S14